MRVAPPIVQGSALDQVYACPVDVVLDRRALELDPVLEANLDAKAARMHSILEPTQAVQVCRDTNVECPGANARARCGFGTPT